MDDAIKRALEVASLAACDGAFDRPCSHPSLCADAGRCLNDMKREEYTAAIAAFLEALPSLSALPVTDGFERVGISVRRSRALAAAVRRAAGGG